MSRVRNDDLLGQTYDDPMHALGKVDRLESPDFARLLLEDLIALDWPRDEAGKLINLGNRVSIHLEAQGSTRGLRSGISAEEVINMSQASRSRA